jgi:hypothetical protein
MDAANDADARAKGWTPAMGSFGNQTYPDGNGGGGGSQAPAQPTDPASAASAALGKIANQMTAALAAGNKEAFDEAVREYNQTFGLDQQKFQASVDQFGQNFGLAQQSEQNKTALGYLNLMAGLRGPANAFQYARTLQGTPQGLTDIVNAAAGRYQLGGVPSGEQSQRASLGTLLSDVNGGAATAGAPGQTFNASAIPDVSGLPAAGQINSRAYNQMLPTQRDLLWGAYEYGGPTARCGQRTRRPCTPNRCRATATRALRLAR